MSVGHTVAVNMDFCGFLQFLSISFVWIVWVQYATDNLSGYQLEFIHLEGSSFLQYMVTTFRITHHRIPEEHFTVAITRVGLRVTQVFLACW